MLVGHIYDWSLVVQARRRTLKLTQAEVAAEARVGRQWIVDLEGGKDGLALAPVLRTLAALGIAVDLRVPDEAPGWTRQLTAAAGERERCAGLRRSARTGRPPEPLRRLAKRPPPSSWLDG